MTAFESTALLLSLKVALAAMMVALPIAVWLAYILARTTSRYRGLLDIIIHLPMVLPPVVVGYGLLSLFGKGTASGRFLSEVLHIDIAFTWVAAAIAAGVMALPLMVRSIRLSIEAIDERLEDVAATLGAAHLRVFFTITLPLSLPGILAAGVLGFARALGEFGATIAFAANIPGATQTLPLAVFTALQQPGGEAAALRLSLISIAVAILALVTAELLNRRLRL